jgi:hypothetical protein
MTKQASKRPNKRARQLPPEQTRFLEALLTMDWLPRDVFNAVLRSLGKTPREYQRRLRRENADWLWFDVKHEKERLRSVGERPYAGGENAAAKTIAHKHGMNIANVEKILHRYKPTPQLQETVKLVIPFLIDGTIPGSTKKWVHWREFLVHLRVNKYRPLLRMERRLMRAQFEQIEAVMKLAGKLATAAGLPAPTNRKPLSWIYPR